MNDLGKWLPAPILAFVGLVLLSVPGVRFSAYLCFGLAGLWALWRLLCRFAENSRFWKACKRIFLAGILTLVLVLAGLETAVVIGGEVSDPAAPVDAILVLGAGVNGETPSLTLRTRINAAADCMELHPGVPVVLSGGQGPGERITEAECMRRSLWSDDAVWNERLLLEERSTSTAENFAFSKEVLRQAGIDTDTAVIGVVTNDFHVFRARLIAGREGMTVVGVPAELPWWWLTANYYLRESFALVKTLIFD